MADIYLRPLGFVRGERAGILVESGQAGRLAGSDTAYTFIEVIERKNGAIERHLHPFTWLAAQAGLEALRRTLEAPRAEIAGLEPAQPLIMGIINVTPDSFSDGGRHFDTQSAIAHGRALAAAGADILDIGGESTRPGADIVDAEAEAARIVPVISALSAEGYFVSADTRKAEVMAAALDAGAAIINDVAALTYEPGCLALMAQRDCPIVLMHAQGDPKTMQDNPQYDDVVLDVYDFLAARIEACEAAGIDRSRLIIDPGIGFGKTVNHNLALTGSLSVLHGLGVPVLYGASRKSFIGHILGEKQPGDRMAGSLGAAVVAMQQMAQILRVHDVKETADITKMVGQGQAW